MGRHGPFTTKANSYLYNVDDIKPPHIMNVGLIFGGVSPEHEVSVITALQAAAAMDRNVYRPVPIYITKEGSWFTGNELLNLEAYKDIDSLILVSQRVHLQRGTRTSMELVADVPKKWFGKQLLHIPIDIMFIALHGGEGENGAVQGICEAYNIPFTGSNVFGSALGMDKVVTKMICRDQGIPVVSSVAFRESEWAEQEEEYLNKCESLGYPMIVKPARLGSSIGIARVETREALDAAIEDAFRYDNKVVVEYAVPNLREVNCSVLGDTQEAVPSVLEEPLTGEELLTFQEKYMRSSDESGGKTGGVKQADDTSAGMASLDRVIPAPLSEKQTEEIRALAVRVFQLFECAGVARIDFLLDGSTGEIYFNEINTIPGSFSFYLWEPSGIPFDQLIQRLIQLGMKRHKEKNRYVRSYDVNLLAMRASGAKGSK